MSFRVSLYHCGIRLTKHPEVMLIMLLAENLQVAQLHGKTVNL